MRVTNVALRPTDASAAAGRPALTPELLAAVGARYSRSNAGLESLLERIDPSRVDQSVDSIFRMVDYGHQSIADMAPVSMFMDGLSIWLACYVWSLCSTAGGQESSTRYIYFDGDAVLDPSELGIPPELHGEWRAMTAAAFSAYDSALAVWETLGAETPALTGIPEALLEATDERSRKAAERMRRNYAFDRARYYLPVGIPTNVMLIMSARGWVSLCQHLCSHALKEARALGAAIRDELKLSAPRLMKHATEKDSIRNGLRAEFDLWRAAAGSLPATLKAGAPATDCESGPTLELLCPAGVSGASMAKALAFHDNRYAWFGSDIRRTAVRFAWRAVAMAEIRDLNRHRTGSKHCPLVPLGFYSALDQIPSERGAEQDSLRKLNETGRAASSRAHALLAQGDPTYLYWTLLGTQFEFEHVSTADKFIYEAELRTGTGAHYRYARHLRDALALWYEKFPETKGLVLEGSAEPE